jgi:hypothetical protein
VDEARRAAQEEYAREAAARQAAEEEREREGVARQAAEAEIARLLAELQRYRDHS